MAQQSLIMHPAINMRCLPKILLVLVVMKSCSAAPAARVETDPELTAGYTEGDMILGDQNRNGLINETYRWPDRIVYYFINSYIGKTHLSVLTNAFYINLSSLL